MLRLYREDLAVSGQHNPFTDDVSFGLYREDLAVSGQQILNISMKVNRLYREDLAVSGQLFDSTNIDLI